MSDKFEYDGPPPVCRYCKNPSVLTLLPGGEVYDRMVWMCAPCSAYVGVVPDWSKEPTNTPLGTLAKHPTRQLRKKAHTLYEMAWKTAKHEEGLTHHTAPAHIRGQIAEHLGIELGDVRFAQFNSKQCKQVLDLLRPYAASEVRFTYRRPAVVTQLALARVPQPILDKFKGDKVGLAQWLIDNPETWDPNEHQVVEHDYGEITDPEGVKVTYVESLI